jgi:hypothetical protein
MQEQSPQEEAGLPGWPAKLSLTGFSAANPFDLFVFMYFLSFFQYLIMDSVIISNL